MPGAKGQTISVVVPVYRSEATLEPLVSRLLATLEGMGRNYEIVLVDDCSPGNNWEVLKKLKERYGKASTLSNTRCDEPVAKMSQRHHSIRSDRRQL